MPHKLKFLPRFAEKSVHPARRLYSVRVPASRTPARGRRPGAPPRSLAARAPAGTRRSSARPTHNQPHETCTNRRWRKAAETCKPAADAARPQPARLGDLWRFRKTNAQVGEPWEAGSMDMNVHRSLTAGVSAGRNPVFDPAPKVQRRLPLVAASRLCGERSPARICRRRCGRPRPVGSFDFGRCAPCAQDDKASRVGGHTCPSVLDCRGFRRSQPRVRSSPEGATAPSARRRFSAVRRALPGTDMPSPLRASVASGVLRLRALRALRSG